MPAFIDLTSHRYGRWTVLSRSTNNKHNQPRWLCRCDCGTEKIIVAGQLRSGGSRSCGCLNVDVHREMCIKRNTTHGLSHTRAHRIWTQLGTRHRSYGWQPPICERWQKFENFLADMGQPPSARHTLDRIDNAKGYEPSNCRWATQKVQQNNRTNNHLITFKGRTQTLMQWAEETGIMRETIWRRLTTLGWPIEEALTREPSPLPRR